MSTLETDYLVVGAGAMALAFVDTILDETDAEVVIVDRYDKPGGHWRIAYDFVRLHQPSDFYGVNSRPLGSGRVETHGPNAGLLELASVDEIREYYDKVMTERFLPSGRVRYLPNSEHLGEGRVSRLLSGEVLEVRARRRIVDGTFMKVQVPAATPPSFMVAEGAQVVPPNGLVRLDRGYDRYVVLGGGKTAIDTLLWLLERGASPDRISWVMPRDAWLYNRATFQPGPQFAEMSDSFQEFFYSAWLEATSVDDLYDRLAASEFVFRLSDAERPTAFRCATVTNAEVDALRTIKDVVRLGHVKRVTPSTLELEQGARTFEGDVVFVNCTANGLARVDPVPVFGRGTITLQSVGVCQQVYSASLIAYVEARYGDDAAKNRMTTPVPHPDRETDFLSAIATWLRNELVWIEDPEFLRWREGVRLSGETTRVGTPLPTSGPERDAALAEARELMAAMVLKTDVLLGEGDVRVEPVVARV